MVHGRRLVLGSKIRERLEKVFSSVSWTFIAHLGSKQGKAFAEKNRLKVERWLGWLSVCVRTRGPELRSSALRQNLGTAETGGS